MSPLIHLDDVSKAYKTEAGDFLALKNVSLEVSSGEFVAVIGKSGSGKSTLINMITGIDRPTQGSIAINGHQIQSLDEGKMAQLRGRQLGVVFQFFQLLPTLTVAENIILPMDFCHLYERSTRYKRALKLLEMVEIDARQAEKFPSQLSGGQQQRVAIARALANDPPIIAADEPTGNLDSKTAGRIFDLFAKLVASGKTIMMVTHDRDLAKRVSRTLVIADGEIIEEYLSHTFKGLTEKQLAWVTSKLVQKWYNPGDIILKRGESVNTFHIVTRGSVEIVIEPANGREFVVAQFGRGQYFGEIELLRGGNSIATVRATLREGAEIATLDRTEFKKFLATSSSLRSLLEKTATVRLKEHRRRER